MVLQDIPVLIEKLNLVTITLHHVTIVVLGIIIIHMIHMSVELRKIRKHVGIIKDIVLRPGDTQADLIMAIST